MPFPPVSQSLQAAGEIVAEYKQRLAIIINDFEAELLEILIMSPLNLIPHPWG